MLKTIYAFFRCNLNTKPAQKLGHIITFAATGPYRPLLPESDLQNDGNTPGISFSETAYWSFRIEQPNVSRRRLAVTNENTGIVTCRKGIFGAAKIHSVLKIRNLQQASS